jgi:hypothetical protein
LEDFKQELMFSVLRAGSYYKRQVYIDSCLSALKNTKMDKCGKDVVDQLSDLWDNRTRHGANKQKFGDYQETILKRCCKEYLSQDKIPKNDAPLIFGTKFSTYCKQIIWNAQRNLGKKITREKPLRTGQVSLSDHDYLIVYG